MYGTVARARVKAGRFEDLRGIFEEWERDRKPKVKGAVAGYVYRLDSDPNTIFLTAVFESKDLYIANAGDPEQDKWFRRMRECLEADPDWNDGEIISG